MCTELAVSNKMTFAFFLSCLLFAVCHGTYVIDDTNGVGRHYDGIGGLSGGGATSKLLINYPDDKRSEILDYLFKPNFGASLQILKVEIGGDSQSTDGTESSHMHESWDENYERGYEWWLMTEAKKRNPNIKLYGLPWAFPGWIGNGTQNPYTIPGRTAEYIIKWVAAAKKYYGLTLDYVGIWNERNYDITYVKTLRKYLDMNNMTSVQIVAADSGWGISNDILKDKDFAQAVDIIGAHYPGTESNNASLSTKKQLWASEDYSTFNDETGAGCWARILNQNYVNGYMTSTISWNLIASYYQDLPFGRDGLMTAEEPWSGHYVVQSPIWVSSHTTQFSDIGWSYLKHGAGVGHLQNGGSYITLVSPDKQHMSLIIETMSHDHSKCIRPSLPAYNVSQQTAVFVLKGSFKDLKELYVWKSKLSFTQEPSQMFEKMENIKVTGGIVTIGLEVDVLYTLTTLSTGQKGSYSDPPPSSPFPLPYKDNYESYQENSEAFNFAPQVGVWEVHHRTTPSPTNVNRQVIITPPVAWCNAGNVPINIGGSHDWKDVLIQIDFLLPAQNASSGVFLGGRVAKGGCSADATSGIFYFIFPSDDGSSFRYQLTNDTARSHVFACGTHHASVKVEQWSHIALFVRGGIVYGYFGLETVFEVEVSAVPDNGYVAFGTSQYGVADFDNLSIEDASAWIPEIKNQL